MPGDLKKRLEDALVGGMVSASIALGKGLGLFDALAAVGSEADPADPKRVADKAGCKERYVREWLCVLGCGNIIEMTPEERFWLSDEAKQEFAGLNNLAVAEMRFLPAVLKTFNELGEAFKKDGPHGLQYAQFTDFYSTMDEVTQAMHSAHLIKDYFPLIGMSDKLSAGGLRILDVGCGSGFHALMMAKNYPKCHIVAVDISTKAIGMAKESQAQMGLTSNLEFHEMDAGHMTPEWADSFDFVTIFDACHDQMRPDLCLKEIHRLLKPQGVFAMLEISGSSNAYQDKQAAPAFATAFYAISMFHCLPVGSNSPDALCMGAMWGEGRARGLLQKAGFAEDGIKVLRPSFFPINIAYLCQKQ